MKKAFFNTATLILVIYAATGLVTKSQTSNKPTTADVKIRQRMSSGNSTGAETVLYIKGQRMRNEMAGNLGFTTILQCDFKRTLTINERTKTYLISSDGATRSTAGEGDGGGTPKPAVPNDQAATPSRGGIVNITNTITDTGERKEMFGFTARRIKTSLVKKASPEACDKDLKVETDGWYIDFQYAFECPGQTQKYQSPPVQSQPGCKDEIRTRTFGTAKLGFPLLVTTTIYQPDGRTNTMTQEVLELSREPLNASLFDVPEGYSLAKDMQELYGMNAAATSATGSRPDSTVTGTSANDKAATTSSITNSSSPKKPGVIRIGLLRPKVQVNVGDAAQAAEALRNSFANHLKGPTIEVVTLAAYVSSQATEEARQSQCDYVLSVSMTVKKGGGGGSMFGRAIGNIAGSAAGHIPGGSSAGTAAARSATITGVYSAATIAGSIKAKDELSLEYELDKTETSNTLLADNSKARAKADGDDILTPLVEKAAQAIVSTVRR